MKKVLITFAALAMVASVYSCRETETKTEEAVEAAVEETQEAMEEVVEEVEEAVDTLATEVEGAVEGEGN